MAKLPALCSGQAPHGSPFSQATGRRTHGALFNGASAGQAITDFRECISSHEILDFLSAIETDLVRSVLDGKDTAQFAVMGLEYKLEYPLQGCHKSCALCLR